ncbi:conserved hypothetical protein, partial [Trichinella spiralis]|uniref:hypothetical protein n=1 Tax=Trichinella spiralis TaxID=6334 RepID=UPI0001EFE2C6
CVIQFIPVFEVTINFTHLFALITCSANKFCIPEDEYYLRKRAGHHFKSLLVITVVFCKIQEILYVKFMLSRERDTFGQLFCKKTLHVEKQFTLIDRLDVLRQR